MARIIPPPGCLPRRAVVESPAERGTRLREARRHAEELRTDGYERPTRECDMVMKGGITSGVVYPLAVCELARAYTFRNIGGTSAGAIAASAAAAAEHGRVSGGFQRLAALPAWVGGHLVSLFQPSQPTTPLFEVLLAAVTPAGSGRARQFRMLRTLLRARAGSFAVGALVVLVLGALAVALAAGGAPAWRLGLGMVPVLPLAAVAGVLAAVWGLARHGRTALEGNLYGICTGTRDPAARERGGGGEGNPPLTDWLAATLDDLAGLPPGEGPLTFGDLWGEESVRAFWAARAVGRIPDRRERRSRRVNLEMMTTNVTHARPLRLPFEGGREARYMFCPAEMARLFPPHVVEHLKARGGPAVPGDHDARPAGDMDPSGQSVGAWICPDPEHSDEHLYDLPLGPDLPVVVATRMSLSFPGLISAVPLYAVDRTRTEEKCRVPVRSWFSDGGISSNFPIHFFDVLWPERPTFGISLAPYHPDRPDQDVYLPRRAGGGREPRLRDTESLAGFVRGILDTMQNWADEGQSALPGYSDRIVEIHRTGQEGGINLAMPAETVEVLAERGREAAEALREFRFPDHRWVRYLTSMAEIEQTLRVMNEAYLRDPPGEPTGYRAFLAGRDPAATPYPRSGAWMAEALRQTERLMTFARELSENETMRFTHGAPRPDPELRITPRF